MRKNRSLKVALAFLTIAVLLTAFEAFGQSTTKISRKCIGASPAVPAASVEVQKDGDIDLIPCSGRSVFANGSPITGALGGVADIQTYSNNLAVAVSSIAATPRRLSISANTACSTAVTIPATLVLQFVNSATIVKSAGCTINFQGQGLANPESNEPAFSGFSAGNITFTGTTWPARISTELFDTGNTSLSARLLILNSAFGTKQVAFVCYPRTITANVDFNANKEIEFKGGEYPSTYSWVSGSNLAFGLTDNTYVHGPSNARLYESTGVYGTRIFGVAGNILTGVLNNIVIDGLTFMGDPAAVSDGSGTTVLLGNVHRGAVRNCLFNGTHAYAVILGGYGSQGYYAYDSVIENNVFIGIATQVIALINAKNCRIVDNYINATSVGGGGALIDIEPNVEDDFMDDISVERNTIVALGDFDGTNTIGGIAFQAAGGVPHIRGAVCRNNIIIGASPASYHPTVQTSRVASGISIIGVLDGVVENNIVRWAFQTAYYITGSRRTVFKNNHTIGSTDVSGFGEAARFLYCNDCDVQDNIFKEVTEYTSSTAMLESEFIFPAVSSGLNLTVTPQGASRIFSFHSGLNVFFNGTVYTIVKPTAELAYVSSATDVNFTTDRITKTAHGFNDTDILRYVSGTTGIGGLAPGFVFYVVNKTANDFQLAATEGGAAINFTSTGTGTQLFEPYGLNTTYQILRMTAAVGTVTTKTFTDATVNVTTDQINIAAHGYQTGGIAKLSTTGVLPTFATNPVTFPTIDGIAHWYIIQIDVNNIKLATTLANALAGTASDITAAAGGGTHTITPEMETRFSSNTFTNNHAPDGIILSTTGTSRILSDYLRVVADSFAPAQITANQNNYNPGRSSYRFDLSTNALLNITGLVFTLNQVNGERHVIYNAGSFNAVLQHENVGSTAGNRFKNSTAADITITPGQAADLEYIGGSVNRWAVFKRN